MKKIYIIIVHVLLIITLGINVHLQNLIKEKEFLSSNKSISEDKNLLTMMVENESGKYEEKNEQEWPSKGYILNKELSKCENGGIVEYQGNNIYVKATSSDRCYVYFDMLATSAKDLSGNNYNGTFNNGALLQQDSEGNVGLYLDGEDDFVDIVDLPETINWADGFTIEFEAKWLSLNSWSRVVDFGNGMAKDNILVGNSSNLTTLRTDIFNDVNGNSFDYLNAIKL